MEPHLQVWMPELEETEETGESGTAIRGLEACPPRRPGEPGPLPPSEGGRALRSSSAGKAGLSDPLAAELAATALRRLYRRRWEAQEGDFRGPPPASEWPVGPGAEASTWALVAALQAVESKVDAVAVRLLSLEGRTGAVEKKVSECERSEVELGAPPEGRWAALGTLVQGYGQLQRRLESMENLLKNRNFWILRFPPGAGGDAPKVPPASDDSASFSQEEWERLEAWQKQLHASVAKGGYEHLISLDYAIAKPEILSQIERGEHPCAHGEHDSPAREHPGERCLGATASAFEMASQIKQEMDPFGDMEEEEEEEEEEEGDSRADAGGETSSVDGWLLNPRAGGSGEPECPWTSAERTEEAFPPEESGCSSPGPEQALGFPAPTTPGIPERASRAGPAGAPPEQPFLCHDRGRCPGRGELLARPGRPPAGERPYACQECGRAFVHQSTLTAHYRTHTGEKPHACAECEKRFARLSTLLEHRRTHTGEKPYACAECGKRFSRLSTLVEHRRTHTGEKPYQCARCHKSFTRLANLTVHQHTHAGEHLYGCTRCGKRFPQKAGFLRHLRGHAREQLYQCQACPERFACPSGLLRHQMGHLGGGPESLAPPGARAVERPFPCPACGKAFRSQQGLRLHQRSHAAGMGANRTLPRVKTEDVG
ncbi:zinc finger protein 777-like [Varanus komodoensis]|uniref:zinc finger protein 777-like n=1 Tax=Varanus komodoensis TaxID=61221 RepID=UPI001CF7829D|nr:zinc finger protein 777-like [Varanus komodoensis]